MQVTAMSFDAPHLLQVAPALEVCYGERFCKPGATNQIQKFPRKVLTFTVLSRQHQAVDYLSK